MVMVMAIGDWLFRHGHVSHLFELNDFTEDVDISTNDRYRSTPIALNALW